MDDLQKGKYEEFLMEKYRRLLIAYVDGRISYDELMLHMPGLLNFYDSFFLHGRPCEVDKIVFGSERADLKCLYLYLESCEHYMRH